MNDSLLRRRVQVRKISQRRFPVAPRLEALEDRLTPTTFNVTPTGAGLNSLAGAVAQANTDATPDTIVLAPGQYNLTGQLTISTPNNLIIEGTASSPDQTVIDPQSENRSFSITGSGSVTLQDVTIQHGQAVDDGTGNVGTAEGGGILAKGGGNVTLSNVVFQSDFAFGRTLASAQGGGIYVQGGSLDIQNSVIRDNDAYGGGGSQHADGGAAFGGGVYFDPGGNPNASLTITNTTVSGNLANGGGGNSGWINPPVAPSSGGNAFGGGIYVGAAGKVTIVGSTLSGNVAQGGPRGGAPASDGGGFGGGAYLGGADTISNSTITDNNAVGGTGYPSWGGGLDFAPNSSASLVNDKVTGNYAGTYGGGINNEGGTVTLTNTVLTGNGAGAGDPDYAENVPGGGGGGGGGSGGGSVAPVGSLMLFGFGLDPGGQLDLLELDQKGQVFALAFSLANFENPNAAGAQLVSTDLILQNLMVTEAGGFPALFGDLVGSNHPSMFLMTVPVEWMPTAALADLLKAWQAAGF